MAPEFPSAKAETAKAAAAETKKANSQVPAETAAALLIAVAAAAAEDPRTVEAIQAGQTLVVEIPAAGMAEPQAVAIQAVAIQVAMVA
jgi:glucose/arabinose dehydrogenase